MNKEEFDSEEDFISAVLKCLESKKRFSSSSNRGEPMKTVESHASDETSDINPAISMSEKFESRENYCRKNQGPGIPDLRLNLANNKLGNKGSEKTDNDRGSLAPNEPCLPTKNKYNPKTFTDSQNICTITNKCDLSQQTPKTTGDLVNNPKSFKSGKNANKVNTIQNRQKSQLIHPVANNSDRLKRPLHSESEFCHKYSPCITIMPEGSLNPYNQETNTNVQVSGSNRKPYNLQVPNAMIKNLEPNFDSLLFSSEFFNDESDLLPMQHGYKVKNTKDNELGGFEPDRYLNMTEQTTRTPLVEPFQEPAQGINPDSHELIGYMEVEACPRDPGSNESNGKRAVNHVDILTLKDSLAHMNGIPKEPKSEKYMYQGNMTKFNDFPVDRDMVTGESDIQKTENHVDIPPLNDSLANISAISCDGDDFMNMLRFSVENCDRPIPNVRRVVFKLVNFSNTHNPNTGIDDIGKPVIMGNTNQSVSNIALGTKFVKNKQCSVLRPTALNSKKITPNKGEGILQVITENSPITYPEKTDAVRDKPYEKIQRLSSDEDFSSSLYDFDGGFLEKWQNGVNIDQPGREHASPLDIDSPIAQEDLQTCENRNNQSGEPPKILEYEEDDLFTGELDIRRSCEKEFHQSANQKSAEFQKCNDNLSSSLHTNLSGANLNEDRDFRYNESQKGIDYTKNFNSTAISLKDNKSAEIYGGTIEEAKNNANYETNGEHQMKTATCVGENDIQIVSVFSDRSDDITPVTKHGKIKAPTGIVFVKKKGRKRHLVPPKPLQNMTEAILSDNLENLGVATTDDKHPKESRTIDFELLDGSKMNFDNGFLNFEDHKLNTDRAVHEIPYINQITPAQDHRFATCDSQQGTKHPLEHRPVSVEKVSTPLNHKVNGSCNSKYSDVEPHYTENPGVLDVQNLSDLDRSGTYHGYTVAVNETNKRQKRDSKSKQNDITCLTNEQHIFTQEHLLSSDPSNVVIKGPKLTISSKKKLYNQNSHGTCSETSKTTVNDEIRTVNGVLNKNMVQESLVNVQKDDVAKYLPVRTMFKLVSYDKIKVRNSDNTDKQHRYDEHIHIVKREVSNQQKTDYGPLKGFDIESREIVDLRDTQQVFQEDISGFSRIIQSKMSEDGDIVGPNIKKQGFVNFQGCDNRESKFHNSSYRNTMAGRTKTLATELSDMKTSRNRKNIWDSDDSQLESMSDIEPDIKLLRASDRHTNKKSTIVNHSIDRNIPVKSSVSQRKCLIDPKSIESPNLKEVEKIDGNNQSLFHPISRETEGLVLPSIRKDYKGLLQPIRRENVDFTTKSIQNNNDGLPNSIRRETEGLVLLSNQNNHGGLLQPIRRENVDFTTKSIQNNNEGLPNSIRRETEGLVLLSNQNNHGGLLHPIRRENVDFTTKSIQNNNEGLPNSIRRETEGLALLSIRNHNERLLHPAAITTSSRDSFPLNPSKTLRIDSHDSSHDIQVLGSGNLNHQKITSRKEDMAAFVLRSVFGLSNFRAGQREVVDSALKSQNVFVQMPTGGGKSLTYQLPALLSPGITLVVSPLISLIHDQVSALHRKGIVALALTGSLTGSDRMSVMNAISVSPPICKILYATPEGLASSSHLRSVLGNTIVSRVVFDEAHCICQLESFRPDYARVGFELRKLLPEVPVTALTATASPNVRESIIQSLGMNNCNLVFLPADRPNLRYTVLKKQKDVDLQIASILEAHPDEAGIIYCLSQRETEQCALALNERFQVRAMFYHAGLSQKERKSIAEEWLNEKAVMCATIAFGMGIDRKDVRFVIHRSISQSLVAYSQESGRAGRDGNYAECVVLYSYQDSRTLKKMIQSESQRASASDYDALNQHSRTNLDYRCPVSNKTSSLRKKLEMLEEVIRFCENRIICRRKLLHESIGEKFTGDCTIKCDNCARIDTNTKDVTFHAQQIKNLIHEQQRKKRLTMKQAATQYFQSLKRDKNIDGLSISLVEEAIKQMILQGILVEKNVRNKAGYTNTYIDIGRGTVTNVQIFLDAQ